MPNYQLPKIIPPSPTAQTFMRYGEIPVDYSTGVPNIDISIYTLEGNKLKVPISISYHASGIKVNDVASEVGLGWALNCGGLVSRSIVGLRDEATTGTRTYHSADDLLQAVNTKAHLGYDQSCECMKGITDIEYFLTQTFPYSEDPASDRYFYKLPNGVTGNFTYDYTNVNDVITLPYRPIKIEKNMTGTGSFKITDTDGTIYAFQSYLASYIQGVSEWFLKQMISADRTDTITFNYILQAGSSSAQVNNFTYLGTVVSSDPNHEPNNPYSSVSQYPSQIPQFSTPVVASITSSKAIVSFTYQDRTDYSFLKRLSEITIASRNAPTAILKKIKINPKYFGTTNEDKRLGLESLLISAAENTQPQQYSFIYESQMLPPYPRKMSTPVYSEDYWGYYNGINNISMLPKEFISNPYDQQYYGANRNADATGYFSKACMLKEIKYPSGGRTVFEFEPNRQVVNGNSTVSGGIRVASITNYSGNNEVANIKTYSYEGLGKREAQGMYFMYEQSTVEKVLIHDNSGDGSTDRYIWVPYSRKVLFSDPILPLEVAPGMPVIYTRVIEYNGTKTSHSGKTIFEYGLPYSPNDLAYDPHPIEYESPWYYSPYNYDKGSYVPELALKKIYSFDGTIYHPIQEERYEYSKLFTKTFTTGIRVTRPKQYQDLSYFQFFCPSTGCPFSLQPIIDEYVQSVVAVDSKAYQESSLLTNTKVYTYDPLDDTRYVLESTNYTYNESNVALKEKITVSSKGELLKSTLKYPPDYSGTAVYDAMVNRNMISPIIEESSYKDVNLLQSTKTNYDFWNGTSWISTITDIIVPRLIESKTLNHATYEPRIRNHTFDTKGNITSVSKENDVKISYIWGYDKTYPIASITNANSSSVFYTSFEDGEGNSNDGDSKTGRKSKTNGYTKSLNGFDDGEYILSYWLKSGGSWIMNNSSVSVVGGSYTINLTQQVDEIRFYPKMAQMVTYTYDPLVGVTSQTDPTGKTMYYEYDGFNRLDNIRDQDRNILKKFQYSYASTAVKSSSTSAPYLSSILSDFRKIRSGEVQKRFVTSDPSSTTQLTDPRDFYRDGVAKLPEVYRTKPGNFYSTLNLRLDNPYYGEPSPRLCFMQQGYSVEWRVKMPATSYNIFSGSYVYYFQIDYSFAAVFEDRYDLGVDNGTYLTRYEDPDGKYGGTHNNPPPGPNKVFADQKKISSSHLFNDFHTIKLQVTDNEYIVAVDGSTVYSRTRDKLSNGSNATVLDDRLYLDAAFYGNDCAVDWVKVSDKDGLQRYYEDFSDGISAARIGSPSTTICATNSDCQEAFRVYYNQRTGSNKTYVEIAQLYLDSYGEVLNPCN